MLYPQFRVGEHTMDTYIKINADSRLVEIFNKKVALIIIVHQLFIILSVLEEPLLI